ncbi:soluble quino protein glucose dehydrogenase [Tothia fuscella]|uniref:Soluble quino protein glucose dehydrogenase n=1 Tax=Tothia fuscella TaxID=1048955 RepID=A0A9P4TUT9_9PEZI|nr:soluble quino protein glucose dehydrogenase [Tothia fuscella]
MARLSILATAALLLQSTRAQSSSSACSATLSASYAAPSVASGYQAKLVANKLTKPRSIIFDSEGHLLVVESGKGITSLTLRDDGNGCVGLSGTQAIINDKSLNHGIEMSTNGKTLYASNSGSVYSWDFDAQAQKNTSTPRELVVGMVNTDHTTRTLMLSRKVNGRLLVSRGSTSNIDSLAQDITSGHSQIRAFDIGALGSDRAAYQFDDEGTLLGWGLRNSVGLAEHPITGGIFSVENSVDEMERQGKDIHESNPGEEMNFHGYLNGTRYAGQGQNYGYPTCYAAWNVSDIPENQSLKPGVQFAIGNLNGTASDSACQNDHVAPVLAFPSHWAPLDLKFNAEGTTAWVTSHGSWNKDRPDGYLVYAIAFSPSTGMPTEPADSMKAVIPIMRNPDNSKCPTGCFRPVGLAFDRMGRLFMSSDSTGEIYMITKTDGKSVASATPTAGAPASTSSPAAASGFAVSTAGLGLVGVVMAIMSWLF